MCQFYPNGACTTVNLTAGAGVLDSFRFARDPPAIGDKCQWARPNMTLGCVERESLRSFCLTGPGRLPRLVRIPTPYPTPVYIATLKRGVRRSYEPDPL